MLIFHLHFYNPYVDFVFEMGGIRILKFTTYVENAISIYRNFCLFGQCVRALIITRIVVELLLIIGHTAIRTNHYYHVPQCKTNVMYFYLTNFNSIALIIFGCCYTKSYKCLTVHLNSRCKFFDSDENYVKSLRSQHAVFVACMFVFCLGKVLMFIYAEMSSVFSPKLSLIWYYVFQTNLLMCDLRYIFEFLVVYCVLHVMSEQLKVVTRSIDTEGVAENNVNDLIMEVDKWSVIYKHIRESAKLFNHVFGIQLTVMLTTSMTYYIIFLYTITSKSVTGNFQLKETTAYLTTLVLMLYILFLVSRAAQLMENSADLLRRRLCKLLILALTNEECYKATKDLLRMMSTRPIRARAFGSISVDMTLLPTCISFFTTYTVIALQFNNVL